MPPFPYIPDAQTVAAKVARGSISLPGVYGAGLGKLLGDMHPHLSAPLLLAVPEPEEAEDIVGDASLFGLRDHLHIFPAWDILPVETDHPEIEIAQARVAALQALLQWQSGAPAPILLTSAAALMQPVLPKEVLVQGHLAARAGAELAPEVLSAKLVDAGLEPVEQVELPGQFCRRGGIMDVFPLLAERPVRLDWFGDELDSVRFFDTVTQESEAACDDEVVLVDVSRDAFAKAYRREEPMALMTYLPQKGAILFCHPERVAYLLEIYRDGFDAENSPLLSESLVNESVRSRPCGLVAEFGDGVSLFDIEPQEKIEMGMTTVERFGGGIEAALAEFHRLLAEKTRVTVFCHNAAERQRLHELLLEKGKGLADRIELVIGHLSKGFSAPQLSWLVLGDHELFGRYQLRRTPRKKYQGAPVADFTQLQEGDYVVHMVHGIARYEGLETLDTQGARGDYLKLRFVEDARIYVPVSHVELVQRFVGSAQGRPKLSKLGGASWQKRKAVAERAAKDIAADLLRLQAVRKALPGIAYPEDDALQTEFDAAFPYEETPDQLAAINGIKADQRGAMPMDRLLCGDVGFGKTEVAMRAAFKTVLAGKQVGVLVPTTILAEQHLRTFRERTADYPVNVGCLSRFRTPAETRVLLRDLAEGRIDIMIGTHRLLSRDVEFKDLGMVIIDEEQRFGVEHKERLKEMRVSVDVLTMTATPIPRTLHMALLGLRDISNLATPPTDRQAIRTMVLRYNEEIIRRAILRELARSGQVFFLHNRVRNIDKIAAELSALVPEARFGVAHGQMHEKQLLDVMSRFLDHKIDVLVCTTIIESGVDIPSVNTLFVNNADHFGLSELHQLRGRVGRYRHKAYAYFLIPKKRPIIPIARKRLHALEEYSELGAGFRLAMRDLEIRGAGNILGAEQSGHINMVGFDLYCRLLEKGIAELKGEKVEEAEPIEFEMGARAYVPTEYINVDAQRIDFYRRLTRCDDEHELQRLQAYIVDRYGPAPQPVEQLFVDQRYRMRMREVGLTHAGRMEDALTLGFAAGRGGRLLSLLRGKGRKITPLEAGRWRLALRAGETPLAALEYLLAFAETSPAETVSAETPSVSPEPAEGKVAKKEEFTAVAEGEEEGARVVGVEPNEALAILGVIVPADAFDIHRFGPVTLATGAGARYFLRFTGTGEASAGHVLLILRAETPETVKVIVDEHLAHGATRLHEGIVEE